MTTATKLLRWLPLIGFLAELFGQGYYLSDYKHPVRYWGSMVYQGMAWVFVPHFIAYYLWLWTHN